MTKSNVEYTAAPLEGDQLAAALRAQKLHKVAYSLKALNELTTAERADWSIYVKYWNAVGLELMRNAPSTKDITSTDVFDEVRKRLGTEQ